ncbi:MAG: hypothetical protein RLY93_12305 [Sumerlaeia bacterium]
MTKDLDEIRNRIRNHSVARISKLSGVSRPNIANIRDGINLNPGILTLNAIQKAIDRLDNPEPAS